MGFTLRIVIDALGNSGETGMTPMMASKKFEISRMFSSGLNYYCGNFEK